MRMEELSLAVALGRAVLTSYLGSTAELALVAGMGVQRKRRVKERESWPSHSLP